MGVEDRQAVSMVWNVCKMMADVLLFVFINIMYSQPIGNN